MFWAKIKTKYIHANSNKTSKDVKFNFKNWWNLVRIHAKSQLNAAKFVLHVFQGLQFEMLRRGSPEKPSKHVLK